jgi:hypothetical protein
MNRTSSRKAWVLGGTVLLAGGISVAILTWWLPEAARHRRAENERHASALLKTLATAEADFRANDRDRNGVHDFWTADVAGLRTYGLISQEVADADARPLVPRPGGPVPCHGYFFVAMQWDDSETPPQDFRQDTDGKSGKVHNRSRFAFCAFPAQYRVTGGNTFIVNEGNTLRWRHTDGDPVLHWPSDEEMRHDWALGD